MNLTRNIVTTLSARIAILALALISSSMLARMLGPEGRGLFALVLLLPELARSFGLLGFDQANAVYAGLEPGRRRALVWQSAVIAGVVGVIASVVGIYGLAFASPLQSLVRGPLWLYLLPLLIVPCGLLADYWGAIIRGMNHILLLNVVEVGTKVASLAFVVVFVAWLRLDVAGAVWADFALNVGTVVLMISLLAGVGVWSRPSFDWPLLKRTGRFALPAHCSTVMTYLNYRVDQFFIAAWLPPEQLAFYVIAVGLAERLWILTGSVANALLPHLTNSQEHDPLLPAVVTRHVIVWTGIACFLVFVLADVIVKVLYSSAFFDAVVPLRWLLPGIVTATMGKVLVAEILAREKISNILAISGVSALVNILGNLVLIPRMGISGAALASSISYSLLSLMVTWYYLRETGVSWTALVPRRSDLLTYVDFGRRALTVTSSSALRS